MAAGTRTIRTRVTSRSTATPSPIAEDLGRRVRLEDERAEDRDHDQGRAGDDPAGGPDALDDGSVRVAVARNCSRTRLSRNTS